MKLGYLGPEGSYSYLATCQLYPKAEKIAYSSFPKVFQAIVHGEVDGGILPIENTLNGGVLQNIDLLERHQTIVASQHIKVKIDHRLMTKEGATISQITDVYSHEQALAQCEGFLTAHCPNATLHKVASTTASLAHLQQPSDAVIVGGHIQKEGCQITPDCISDYPDNYTHFLYCHLGELPQRATEHIYFSATCMHRPGALLKLLSILNEYECNMTKIESRPLKSKEGEYIFFIEVEGDYTSSRVQSMLKAVQEFTHSLHVIGAY